MRKFILFILIICCGVISTYSKSIDNSIDFNFDWKFRLITNKQQINDKLIYSDGWQDVRLPHDWSIYEGYTKQNTSGSNAFLPGGIGVYYKKFKKLAAWKDKKIFINFQGIYNRSTVWINNQLLGFSPNGYLDQEYEIGKYLKDNEENIIVVKVDRSAYADTRWYAGAGIYRNVSLILRNDIYIPTDGVYVTTPVVSKENSKLSISTEVVNSGLGVKQITINQELRDGDRIIAKGNIQRVALRGCTNEFKDELVARDVTLWDLNNPKLYQLVTTIISGDKIVERKTTEVGIRDIKFDAERGFLLNGVSTKIKGVNLHQDLGCLGEAVYDDALYYRLCKLRAMGCNAIRTAHNPHSKSLFAMCDSMGILVMDEFIDEWLVAKGKWISKRGDKDAPKELSSCYSDYFATDAEKDIKRFIKRDRNHPCVILWSIGNEIEWTYPYYWASSKDNKGFGGLIYTGSPEKDSELVRSRFNKLSKGKDELSETAVKLANWVREIDKTHPITAGVVIPSVSRVSGYTDVLDVVGYNYKDAYYEPDHKQYPNQPIFGTENVGQYYEWKAVLDKPYISGIFVWTGIDYLGENGPWPLRGGDYSFFDFAMNKTPRGHFFECLWKNSPKTHIVTTPASESEFKPIGDDKYKLELRSGWIRRWEWYKTYDKWDYKDNDSIIVQIYSNASQVELFLNNKSLGRKNRSDFSDNNVMLWMVPYHKGSLVAVGYDNDKEVSRYELQTPGKPKNINVVTDKSSICDDGYSMINLEISITDSKGTLITDKDVDITIENDDKLEIAGVDNGSVSINKVNKDNKVRTFNGKCLVVLRSKIGKEGLAKIKLRSSNGLVKNIKFPIKHL